MTRPHEPDRPGPLRLAVCISGSGTTLLNLHREIVAGRLPAEIVLAAADRPCAGLERAAALGLPTCLCGEKSREARSERIFERIRAAGADLVVLGGFLSLISIPDDFTMRVMNIHPALIPAFSGKGMHGARVHRAVLERGCKVSGCTVHFCDNEYDHGPIILQKVVPVREDDTPETLAARVFEAECEAYPEAIRWFAETRGQRAGARGEGRGS